MKTFYVLLSAIILLQACNLSKNKTVTDKKTRKKELVGECNRKAFDKKEFKNWFEKEYHLYKPDKEITEELKNPELYKNVKIKVIFGTWCGDSRRELPRFYKIVDVAEIPENIIILTAVNTDKESEDKSLTNINFKRIPTFIFYKNEKEIGRIVESAKESLEKDILNILSK